MSTDNTVKYHLVEAEEVKDAPTSTQKTPKKMHWSQFVDEMNESNPSKSKKSTSSKKMTSSATSSKSSSSKSKSRSRRNQNKRNNQMYQDDNGTYLNGVYVPHNDPRMTVEWAKQQIEFYFSPDNLVRDVFLRQQFDVNGYVPVALLANFQAVYSLHQDYDTLLESLKKSKILEMDEENEKVRLKENWEKWLWPQGDGTYGVPEYKINKNEQEKKTTSDLVQQPIVAN